MFKRKGVLFHRNWNHNTNFISPYVLCHLSSPQPQTSLYSSGQHPTNVTGLLCVTMMAMLGNYPPGNSRKCVFSCFFHVHTFYKATVVMAHKSRSLIKQRPDWEYIVQPKCELHVCPKVSYLGTVKSVCNGNSSIWVVLWEHDTHRSASWHLHSQAHHRLGATWVFCFYSLAHNVLWRYITLPPQMTKMLLFAPSLKIGCGWQK